MMSMIKRLASMLLVLLLGVAVVVGTFKVSGSYLLNKSYKINTAKIKGTIVGFDSNFILIEFNKQIIKNEGDTRINAFLVKDGTHIQLKPIYIPEGKASDFNTNNLVLFPISDIFRLLTPEVYHIEIFISNSKYSEDAIELKPIKLDLTPYKKKENEKEKF